MRLLLALVAVAAQADDPKPPPGDLPAAAQSGPLRLALKTVYAWNDFMPIQPGPEGTRHLILELEVANAGTADVDLDLAGTWLSVKPKELGDRVECPDADGKTRFKIAAGAKRTIKLRAPRNAYPGLKQGAVELQATMLLKSDGGAAWLRSTSKIERTD